MVGFLAKHFFFSHGPDNTINILKKESHNNSVAKKTYNKKYRHVRCKTMKRTKKNKRTILKIEFFLVHSHQPFKRTVSRRGGKHRESLRYGLTTPAPKEISKWFSGGMFQTRYIYEVHWHTFPPNTQTGSSPLVDRFTQSQSSRPVFNPFLQVFTTGQFGVTIDTQCIRPPPGINNRFLFLFSLRWCSGFAGYFCFLRVIHA